LSITELTGDFDAGPGSGVQPATLQPTANVQSIIRTYSAGNGANLASPLILASVKWGLIIDAHNLLATKPTSGYTYANGTAGVGATITHNQNGVLAIDGGSPALGDRVVFCDSDSDYQSNGIYTVTNVGSAGSEWVLTRSSDNNTPATNGCYWAVTITNGTQWSEGFVYVAGVSPAPGAVSPFVIGTGYLYMASQTVGCNAIGGGSTVQNNVGQAGIALMEGTVGPHGNSGAALGYNSYANGGQTVAVGPVSIAIGTFSVAVGPYATSSGYQCIAVGNYCATTISNATGIVGLFAGYATTNGAGGLAGYAGRFQKTEVLMAGSTANATPTLIGTDYINYLPLRYVNPNTLAVINDFTKTIIVKGSVVARRVDTPGTDSAWSLQGVLRGNGSTTYTWVGGSAPSPTLIAQDAVASGWTFALSYDATDVGIQITVTGEAANTIDWCAFVELDEIS